MRTRAAIAFLGLLALALPACAQVPGVPHLEPGQRVRIHVRETESARRTGVMVALTADSLALALGSDTPERGEASLVAFPVADIKRVGISTGVHPQTLEGPYRGG